MVSDDNHLCDRSLESVSKSTGFDSLLVWSQNLTTSAYPGKFNPRSDGAKLRKTAKPPRELLTLQ